eukprot:1160050-Pelagomonas_calceolata.AAC.8
MLGVVGTGSLGSSCCRCWCCWRCQCGCNSGLSSSVPVGDTGAAPRGASGSGMVLLVDPPPARPPLLLLLPSFWVSSPPCAPLDGR